MRAQGVLRHRGAAWHQRQVAMRPVFRVIEDAGACHRSLCVVCCDVCVSLFVLFLTVLERCASFGVFDSHVRFVRSLVAPTSPLGAPLARGAGPTLCAHCGRAAGSAAWRRCRPFSAWILCHASRSSTIVGCATLGKGPATPSKCVLAVLRGSCTSLCVWVTPVACLLALGCGQCFVDSCAVRYHPICGRTKMFTMVLYNKKLQAACAAHSNQLIEALRVIP